MWFLPLVCYVFSLFLTLTGIQWHISIIKYPLYLTVPLALAVFIPLSIIFLLPIDYVAHNSPLDIVWFDLPDRVILYLWKFNYWITFLLTWLILPLLQEFFRSGHFSKLSKLKDAAKRNIKFQFIILGVSIAGLIYLMLEVGLSLSHVKLMIIAMSHIYSLVLALWLMAHGLISIPRNMWISGSLLQDLNHHYLKVPKLVDNLEDIKITFKEDVLQVLVLTKSFTSASGEDFRFRDWILQLYNKIPLELKEFMEQQYRHDASNIIARDQVTVHFMTKLTASFNQNLYKLNSYEAEFNSLLKKIVSLEDVLNCSTNDNLLERNRLVYRIDDHRSLLLPKYRFLFEYYFRPVCNRLLSIVLFIVSFLILESEFFHSTKISLINVLIYSTGINNHNLLQLIVCCIIFSYMLFASLNSLTHLKIFNMYHLVPHNSDPVSACFYTTYIARLTIPLSYNFITLFVSRNSIFEDWFGKSIHLTGLFNSMNNWIPRFVLIPVLLTVFNVYDKLKKRLGLTSDLYDSWALFDDDENNERNTDIENLNNKRKDLIIVEAKRTIDREMLKLTQRRTSPADTLRPFNLTSAADLNYENNRLQFNTSLMEPVNQRIDSFHNEDEQNSSNTNDIEPRASKLWGKIGGVLNGLKSNVSTNFNRNTSREYRDDPTEDEDNILL